MALPEAHAEPAVQEGVCYALFAYDAGLAINLDESERRITALTQRAAIRHKRRAPRYFEYRPAPLRVTQEREALAVGAFRTAPSVEAVLYDFGAVSVTYQVPLAGPLAHLITLAEELYESAVLLADSRRWVEQLLATIAPAVTRPGLTDIVELLEMRYLDQQLDDALDESYDTLSRRDGLWLPGVTRADLRRIGQLQVDNAVLFEGVNNALKLLGDQYLARVYRLVSERFHLAEWDASILRKLQTLESIYQKLSDQSANRRTEALEGIIIARIAAQILIPFVPGLVGLR